MYSKISNTNAQVKSSGSFLDSRSVKITLKQMSLHYIFHLIIILIAHFIGISYISYQVLPIYIFTAYASIQIFTLTTKFQFLQNYDLLFTFLPYIPFHYLSNEYHKEFGVIWFSSVSSIILQINHQRGHRLLQAYCIGFVFVYAILTSTMPTVMNLTDWNYKSVESKTCGNVTESCSCPTNYIINNMTNECRYFKPFELLVMDEILYVVGIVILSVSFLSLEIHQRDYRSELKERKELVNELIDDNNVLRSELSQFPNAKISELDLNSPMTNVIRMIRNLQIYSDIDIDTIRSLDQVVHLLSSPQLFQPQLKSTDMESEVSQWLLEITNRNENEGSAEDGKSESLTFQKGIWSIENLGETTKTLPETRKVLEKVDLWEFDVFSLRDTSRGKPLVHLGMELFDKYEFEKKLGIPPFVMYTYFSSVESSYRNENTYHNSTHATDVLHAINYFITTMGLRSILTDEDVFSCVIAAAIHDVDHPGYNNGFMIATMSPIALRYNDISVLENYHLAKGFELLQQPSCNIFEGLPAERVKTIRSSVISMVLATDMINHFEYITKFKNKVNSDGFDHNDTKTRQLLMDIAIKCGDISNVAKPNNLAVKWTGLIMAEFFRQGDEEKKLGLPISPLMDRTNTIVSKCQLGFIDFIVLPLYEVWDKYLMDRAAKDGNKIVFPAIQYIKATKEYWKSRQDESNS